MIAKLAMVATGGALGASLRFLVGHWTLRAFGPGFPWGTFAVNIVGSFVMGLAAVWMMERMPGAWGRFAPFLMTGVLGGFTTFSAFSLDALSLMERGKIGLAALYIGGSVVLAIGGLWLGMLMARAL
ncbi:MAG: fluoride efflux transporter CrcB [Pseudomonadota bacterium]